MEQKQLKVKRITIITSMLYSIFMILYSSVPRIFIMGISLVIVWYLYYRLRTIFSTQDSLLITSIYMLPTSFVSILATNTSKFPFSWFHILFMCLFIMVCFTKRVNKRYFIFTLIFFGFSITYALVPPSFLDAIKQILTILLFLFSFIIGEQYRNIENRILLSFSTDALLSSSVALGFQILLQRFIIQSSGVIIGHFARMGQGRVAYAGLMGDYSFTTLYLAVGFMIVFVYYMDYKRISIIEFIILELFLLISIISVTSRTGLAALAITLVLYLIKNAKRLNLRTLFIILLGCIAIPIVLNELLTARSGQSLLDSSGRLSNYTKALKYFVSNPLIGAGYGLNNLYERTSLAVPHNFFIQYLLQIGIVGTVLILLFFITYLIYNYNRNSPLKWLFWIIVIGSMFIPDIASSRFGSIVIILTMMNGDLYEYEKTTGRKNVI